MRPWRLRSQQRQGHCPHASPGRAGLPQEPRSLVDFDGYHPNQPLQQEFPNFRNRLAPVGGRPQSGGRRNVDLKNDFVDGNSENEEIELKIPESPPYPSRPPLSNIFPMYNDSLQSKATAQQMTDVNNDQRRHSISVIPTSPILLQATPSPGTADRRASSSSDTSADKSRQGRRERRASVTRDLPILPKRNQFPFQLLAQGSPPISPYSEYTGPLQNPYPPRIVPDQSNERQLVLNFGAMNRPPVAPGGLQSNFSYPTAWSQPYQQLQELQEELEDDGEGDGEEGGVTKIDEVEEEELEVLKTTPMPLRDPHKDLGKDGGGGGGFGKKLRDIMSSKHRSEPVAMKTAKGVKAEGDTEIKGFDDFFMY